MCFYTFHRFNMEKQIGGSATATLGNEMKLNKTGLQACCLWMNQPWKPVDSSKLQRHIITVEVTKLFGLPTFSCSPLMFSVVTSTCFCSVLPSSLHDRHTRTHTRTLPHRERPQVWNLSLAGGWGPTCERAWCNELWNICAFAEPPNRSLSLNRAGTLLPWSPQSSVSSRPLFT